MNSTLATFAAGCFWGVEEAFCHLPGVINTRVGYCGGHLHSPTYQQVCSGDTGHAEVVQIEFDRDKMSYEDLLAAFWQCHNPTSLNRQGPDVGSQYRSAIFYHDDEQASLAKQSKAKLVESGQFHLPVVTEIVPVGEFYPAEDYHQRYLAKNGMAHCPLKGHDQ